MENRRRPGRDEPPPPPPSPYPNPSPVLLRDVSNYKTPRPPPPSLHHPPSPIPIFFTASKKTPSSSAVSAFRRRPSVSANAAPPSHSKAVRRLRAFELEQSRSARKAQIRREKALRSFSRSISTWLNFLFRDPRSCGCSVDSGTGNQAAGPICGRGKRNSLDGRGDLKVEGSWRCPKRQRGYNQNPEAVAPSASSLLLQVSLKDVCSFEDLKERMSAYLSTKGCQEVLSVMGQVCKNIDEGRLKVKANCPIVTDVGHKEKAMKVLSCYSPIWLRIGLYIILGGDLLLQTEEGNSVSEDQFVKMVIERQFFTHAHLAKSYAYNKLVEGIYRPGYFEALGDIILKRFLLLVLLLDKAKCESTFPVKYGVDSVDGGSPLLFCRQSHIKSSRQVICEFLSEVMHGEGDLLAHLVIVGYKVSHQQSSLAEYDFHVTNLFEDLQDGILLCRTIQLLQNDASALATLVTPSDTRKKNIQNCNVALEYLKLAGVPLYDEDGVLIVAEDVANGDRELILSLLWNIFIHLQLPLLIKKTVLIEEIAKVKGCDMNLSKCDRQTHMDLLLEWVQATAERHCIKVDTLSSLIDGKALRCVVNYYFRHQAPEGDTDGPLPLFNTENTVAVHNFVLVQRVATMLGNLPELLQVSDILDKDAAYDERSVIILLVFLASQLLLQQKLDHVNIYKLIRSSFWSPFEKTCRVPVSLHRRNSFLRNPDSHVLTFNAPVEQDETAKYEIEDCAAKVIQCRFRGLMARKKFLKVKSATKLLQGVTKAWLAATRKNMSAKVNHTFPGLKLSLACFKSSDIFGRYYIFISDRQLYINMKKSVLVIQKAVRAWMAMRNQIGATSLEASPFSVWDSTTTMNSHVCNQMVRSRYHLMHSQVQENEHIFHDSDIVEDNRMATVRTLHTCRGLISSQQNSAATIIQSHWRGWLTKRMFVFQMRAVVKIQNELRSFYFRKAFKQMRHAATAIQQVVRGQIIRNRLLGASCHRFGRLPSGSSNVINSRYTRCKELQIVIDSILKLQRWWRHSLFLRSRTFSAIIIQSYVRGYFGRRQGTRMQQSIVIIQKWWRSILFIKSRKRAVLIIQSHVRGWIDRRIAARKRHRISVIQAYWKGHLVRRNARHQISNLRCRVQKSAANVDDDMRLINRHLSALSLLLSHKSISSIRHTCSTINVATEHSQKCCEVLVDAGAIDTLLKEITNLTRSGPDQEVLKHILSILRNIVRYTSLARRLISTPQSVEIIFQEFLRNKNEGYFVAFELLKRLFVLEEAREVASSLQGHVRRLNHLIQKLERKVDLQKRNARLTAARGDTEQRFRSALAVQQLVMGS